MYTSRQRDGQAELFGKGFKMPPYLKSKVELRVEKKEKG